MPRVPRLSDMKKVLVLVYSQTGQLSSIAQSLTAPLVENPGIAVHVEYLRPASPYPFPWSLPRFLDAFPESALGIPCELAPPALPPDAEFDLILLFYQVWYLAPSPPVTAFLRSEAGRRLLAGKPVVTVVGCRNMWMKAHERMVLLLAEIAARHIDHVVFTDRAPTLATLLTTPLWLLTGKRRPVPGLPPAGVRDDDIQRAARFGHALADALAADRERGNGPLLGGLAAVEARPELMASENAGTRSFALWSRIVRLGGEPGAPLRLVFLTLFLVYLVAIILTVVPVSLGLQRLLRPLMKRRLAAIKRHMEWPSGSGTERMAHYER